MQSYLTSSLTLYYHGSNLSVDIVDHSTSAAIPTDLITRNSDEAKARNCFETGLILLSGDSLANLPPLRLMWTAELVARAS